MPASKDTLQAKVSEPVCLGIDISDEYYTLLLLPTKIEGFNKTQIPATKSLKNILVYYNIINEPVRYC